MSAVPRCLHTYSQRHQYRTHDRWLTMTKLPYPTSAQAMLPRLAMYQNSQKGRPQQQKSGRGKALLQGGRCQQTHNPSGLCTCLQPHRGSSLPAGSASSLCSPPRDEALHCTHDWLHIFCHRLESTAQGNACWIKLALATSV